MVVVMIIVVEVGQMLLRRMGRIELIEATPWCKKTQIMKTSMFL